MTLVPGDDIDQDGDSDVFAPSPGARTCRDADADGDIEFPAGFYEAGTILDNDVSHNNAATWTVGPPDGVANNVDLEAVATHEFGHSHGLSHSFINQLSGTNAGGATMFPFIDSNDPTNELAQRSLGDRRRRRRSPIPRARPRAGPPPCSRAIFPSSSSSP